MIYLDMAFHYRGSGGREEGNRVEEGVMTGLGGARGEEETGNREGHHFDMLDCSESEYYKNKHICTNHSTTDKTNGTK